MLNKTKICCRPEGLRSARSPSGLIYAPAPGLKKGAGGAALGGRRPRGARFARASRRKAPAKSRPPCPLFLARAGYK
ncbi:MAG: hypothetical protein DBY09_07700 [Selenomonadales bacterium]|nr:MAG: hypothetical protein DBY09_07700 [Selenomonadales bacterium]